MVLTLEAGRHQPSSQGVGGPGRSATSALRQGQGVVSPSNHGVRPLVQTSFNELNGEISPDGHWMAYQSNDSGQDGDLRAAVSGC